MTRSKAPPEEIRARRRAGMRRLREGRVARGVCIVCEDPATGWRCEPCCQIERERRKASAP